MVERCYTCEKNKADCLAKGTIQAQNLTPEDLPQILERNDIFRECPRYPEWFTGSPEPQDKPAYVFEDYGDDEDSFEDLLDSIGTPDYNEVKEDRRFGLVKWKKKEEMIDKLILNDPEVEVFEQMLEYLDFFPYREESEHKMLREQKLIALVDEHFGGSEESRRRLSTCLAVYRGFHFRYRYGNKERKKRKNMNSTSSINLYLDGSVD